MNELIATLSGSSFVVPILTVIVSACFSVLSAILATSLALKRFRKEQLWVREADSYESLLTSLFDVYCSYKDKQEKLMSRFAHNGDTSMTDDNDRKAVEEAMKSVDKCYYTKAMFFSKKVKIALDEYSERHNDSANDDNVKLTAYYGGVIKNTDNIMKEVSEIAKEALSLR